MAEFQLLKACSDAIRNDPESAKMARLGHGRGYMFLIHEVKKQLGEAAPKEEEIKREIVRLLKV